MSPIDLGAGRDDGLPDPVLAAALAAWAEGAGAEGVHTALLTARIYAPGVYVPESAQLALVALRRSDGATAVPAFTGIAALSSWRPDSRPLAHQAAALAAVACAEGYAAMVLDPAGPVTFVVPADVLNELAKGYVPMAADTRLSTRHSALGPQLRPATDPPDPAVSVGLATAAPGSPVRAVYAVEARVGDEPFTPALGIVLADGAGPSEFATVGSALADALGAGLHEQGLGLVLLGSDQAAEMARTAPALWRRDC